MTDSQGLAVPILTTDRLVLEPLTLSHSQGMFDLWSSSRVCEYCSKAVDLCGNRIKLPVEDSKESDKVIDFFTDYQKRTLGFRWAMILADTPKFVGAIGFNALGDCSELAYHLIPKYWGMGLMTEACSAAIDWVKGEVDVFIEPKNASSIRLVERLGFVLTGESSEGTNRYLLANER